MIWLFISYNSVAVSGWDELCGSKWIVTKFLLEIITQAVYEGGGFGNTPNHISVI